MPNYVLKCPKCGTAEEKVCIMEERNNHKCRCGNKMKVQITTANFVYRGLNLRVQKWMKERNV